MNIVRRFLNTVDMINADIIGGGNNNFIIGFAGINHSHDTDHLCPDGRNGTILIWDCDSNDTFLNDVEKLNL